MTVDKSRSKTWWRKKVVLDRKNTWSLVPGFTFTLLCLTLWQLLRDTGFDSFNRGPATTNHPHFPDNADDDHPEKCPWINRPSQHSLLLLGCGCPVPECHWAGELPDNLWTLKISTSPPILLRLIGTFGADCHEFCRPCFTVSTAFLTLSNYSSKIFRNRWYKHVLSTSGGLAFK